MAEEYAVNWTAVLIVAGVGAAAVIGMFVASYIIAPKRPSAIKDIPYECGIETRAVSVVADSDSLLCVRHPVPDFRRGGGVPVSVGGGVP